MKSFVSGQEKRLKQDLCFKPGAELEDGRGDSVRELPEPFMSGRKPVFLSALVTSSLSARKSRAISWPSQPTPLASSPPGGSLLFPGFGTEPFALALPAHNSQADCSNTTPTKLFASCLLN